MIKTLNEFVIVKVLEESQNENGVLLPENHKNLQLGMGEVLAVQDNSVLEEGDVVYFDKVLLTVVKIKGEDLNFIKFSDIMGYERTGETKSS